MRCCTWPASRERGRGRATARSALDDIKHFRQLGSHTPGHPEYRLTTGVETTTGPLGQGCGNSVGMAMAQRWLAARYNRPGFELFDYRIYAMCGDGDMMEGVSSEAASLAGHLKPRQPRLDLRQQPASPSRAAPSLAFNEDVGGALRRLWLARPATWPTPTTPLRSPRR